MTADERRHKVAQLAAMALMLELPIKEVSIDHGVELYKEGESPPKSTEPLKIATFSTTSDDPMENYTYLVEEPKGRE